MSIENGRVIALGSAYVEGKITSSELQLPLQRAQLPAFLDAHPEADLYAGGSIPNILTSFVRLSGNPNTRLFCCVGDDTRGKFYSENMDRRLGDPAVSTRQPTGAWVGIYNNRLVEGLDFYGASTDLVVPIQELQLAKNEVFITDVDFCCIPETHEQVGTALSAVEDQGIFALSLVGTSPKRASDIDKILSSFDRQPMLVFGNASELLALANCAEVENAIKEVFPSSRLVVITEGEKGAHIKFDGHVISIPAKYVPKNNVIDETGAGDSYMGTMLAILLRNNYKDWRIDNVVSAAQTATFASTLVIQSMQSRLTPTMVELILDYEKTYLKPESNS